MPSAHYAFLLCGTRGDVEPCVHVAAALQAASPDSTILVATHAAHASWLSPLLARSALQSAWLSSLPALTWEGASSGSQTSHEEEITTLLMPPAAPPRLVAYNLFCLEAAHVAEALGVASVALSPYAMPHAMPAALPERLREEAPGLWEGLACPGRAGACRCTLGSWQYALLNAARWGRLRAALGLPRLPPLSPRAPALLYGMSQRLLPAGLAGAPLRGLCATGRAGVQLTGQWHGGWEPCEAPPAWGPWLEPVAPCAALRAPPPPQLEPPPAPRAVVLLTFGSMTSLGAVGWAEELPRALSLVRAAALRRGVAVLALVPCGAPPAAQRLEGEEGTLAWVHRRTGEGRGAGGGAAGAAVSEEEAHTCGGAVGAQGPASGGAAGAPQGPACGGAAGAPQGPACGGAVGAPQGPACGGTVGAQGPVHEGAAGPPQGAAPSYGAPRDPASEESPRTPSGAPRDPSRESAHPGGAPHDDGWREYARWVWSLSSGAAGRQPPPPPLAASAAPMALLAGEVALAALLPHCAAAIHHGGSGTTAAAARAGCPQLLLPLLFDQPGWGEAVAAAGCGPPPRPLWGLLEAPAQRAAEALAGDLRCMLPEGAPARAAARALAAALRAEGHGAARAASAILQRGGGAG